MNALKIGVITVSDRASRGEYEDRSGPEVSAWLRRWIATPVEISARLVPDEHEPIRAILEQLSGDGCGLLVTTGGTGPAPRDVTPEVTRAFCDRLLPGLAESMRASSRDRVPTAMLSRGVAGIRGATLVINLPGSPGGIKDCLEAVFVAVPHCLKLIGAGEIELSDGGVTSYDPHHE